jgi:gliding motility-associated lipoprotein GldH
MNFPNSEVVSDTLQYAMAKPDGEWLGTGFDVKESKLWYKENVKFPSSGNYKVTVQQAVRKLGNVQGDQALDGITDVGITIEKATK